MYYLFPFKLLVDIEVRQLFPEIEVAQFFPDSEVQLFPNSEKFHWRWSTTTVGECLHGHYTILVGAILFTNLNIA